MSQICLVGDPHFSNRKLFGYPTVMPGRNSRLQKTVDTFFWISAKLDVDYPDVHEVYILGDITHEHGVLTPPVYEAVRASLTTLTDQGREVHLLAGNHDQDVNGLSFLRAFTNDESIFLFEDKEEFCSWPCGGLTIVPVSYGSDLDALRMTVLAEQAGPFLLFMHHHFEGAAHGAHEFEPPGGLSISDFPDSVRLIVSGHYHKRQWLFNKRLLYVGAPLKHDFGEATYTPGFAILDIPDNPKREVKVEFVDTPTKVAPDFHILPYTMKEEDLPGLPETDYYRIDRPTDVDPNTTAWLSKAVKHWAVKSLPASMTLRSRVEDYLAETANSPAPGGRVELGEVIEAYTVLNIQEQDRQDELIRLGKEIANKVISER